MRYLVAETMRHAMATAQTDCEWEQIGPRKFLDNEGEEVQVVMVDPEFFQGRHGSILYTGHGCYLHRDWERCRQMCLAMRVELRTPELSPRVAAILAKQRMGY